MSQRRAKAPARTFGLHSLGLHRCGRCRRIIDNRCRTLAEDPAQCRCVNPLPTTDDGQLLLGVRHPAEVYRAIISHVVHNNRRRT